MGLTVAKCPACGVNLDLETDNDYFFCPHCGSKVLQQDNRIVIEHVSRTVDEAEVRRIELEEKKRIEKSEEQKQTAENLSRVGKILTIVCCAGFILSFFIRSNLTVMIRFLSIEFGVFTLLMWMLPKRKK